MNQIKMIEMKKTNSKKKKKKCWAEKVTVLVAVTCNL